MPATAEQTVPQLKTVEDMARAFRALEIEAKRLATENAQLKAMRTGPLTDQELQIGTHVAARVGASDYVPAEVTDVYTSASGRGCLYALKRLDDGKKGLNPKPASDLFPPERAGT